MTSLKGNEFELNPYDPCVANKMIEDNVLTICFHMDHCKIAHESTPVVDNTNSWLKEDFEVLFEDGLGAMKV